MEFVVTQEDLERRVNRSLNNMKENAAKGLPAFAYTLSELVECSARERRVLYRYRVPPETRNNPGTMHGGMQAILFDNCMSALSGAFSESRRCTTLSLEVSYLRPILPGQELLVEVKLLRAGSRTHYLTGSIFSAEEPNNPYSVASAVFLPMPRK